MLADKHAGAQAMVFVEDKLSTLEKVCVVGACMSVFVLCLSHEDGKRHSTRATADHCPPSRSSQVAKDPQLDGWELFLVDWGYNTPEERARASANPRIEVVDAQGFAALLRR